MTFLSKLKSSSIGVSKSYFFLKSDEYHDLLIHPLLVFFILQFFLFFRVSRDADEKDIKKAHRKLVLKYHPDKNYGNDDAAKEFRLVQEAYECLTDPSERKWYDEHRESILRGGHGFGGADDSYQGEGFVFDVTPFHFAGCYDGYGDGEGGFFTVYNKAFASIIDGELKGWLSEGNIDEQKMPNINLRGLSFVSSRITLLTVCMLLWYLTSSQISTLMSSGKWINRMERCSSFL